MTKKEQQKMDRQLQNISDKLLINGWRQCQDIVDDIYERLLTIMAHDIAEQQQNIKNYKNKELML